MVKITSIVFLLLLWISYGSCQTFQYSRGWTNGKRSDNSVPIATLFDYKPMQLFSQDQIIGKLARCASELHKWRIFLHPDDNGEVCRVPCEFMELLRDCLHPDKVTLGQTTSSSSSSEIF